MKFSMQTQRLFEQEQSTPSTQAANALGDRRRKKTKANRKTARNFIFLESGHEFEEAELRIGLRYILSRSR